MGLVIFLLLLIVLGLMAYSFGADSTDDISSREWDKRRSWPPTCR